MDKKEMELRLAVEIARTMHYGQTDKQGVDYFIHPVEVAKRCDSIEAKIVAMLHDIVEDTEITLDDLKKLRFDDEIIEAVRCVTKEKGYDEEEYYERIKANELARVVKLADLSHNSDLTRILEGPAECKEKLLEKRKTYLKKIEFLQVDEKFYQICDERHNGMIFKVVDYKPYIYEDGNWKFWNASYYMTGDGICDKKEITKEEAYEKLGCV